MDLTTITPAQATLLTGITAACIAAAAALITLIFTLLNKRGEEFRTAYREVIAGDLKTVGKAVHEVIALSNIQLKVLTAPQHPEKYRLAQEAAKRLKEQRHEVRYTLWGLDEGFRTLARLPDWIGHAKANPVVAAELFKLANRLGLQIDLAVRAAYVNGATPGRWRKFRVNWAASRLKKTYNQFSETRLED